MGGGSTVQAVQKKLKKNKKNYLRSSRVPTTADMCGGSTAQAVSERKGPKERWLMLKK
jgi:hypothetical protein